MKPKILCARSPPEADEGYCTQYKLCTKVRDASRTILYPYFFSPEQQHSDFFQSVRLRTKAMSAREPLVVPNVAPLLKKWDL